MESIAIWPLALRFILGGSAVVVSTLVARAFGGRIGGVFAAFPAVYLAAIISLWLECRGDELLLVSMHVSQGALVGMFADIICAVIASRWIIKMGWKKGLSLALVVWLVVATSVFFTLKMFF